MPSLALSEHGNSKCILLFPTFSIAYGDKNGGASLCRWNIRTIQWFLRTIFTSIFSLTWNVVWRF